MKKIKIKCPAKINLTLEVVNRREDGYHNIKSVMQTINLYDYLNIEVEGAEKTKIVLSGNSNEIPYNEHNLVYKAADLYLKSTGIKEVLINISIEKNIPIAAGLAGGSTDAAGTLFGLNKIFDKLNNSQIDDLCAHLGSDLNVCFHGGCVLATSRGEITEPLPVRHAELTLIKPKNIGISAKEAYTKYTAKVSKPKYNMTEKLTEALYNGGEIGQFLYNDLEYAIFDDYKELQKIKHAYPKSVMSGSGSTYFVLENIENPKLDDNYLFLNNLKFIQAGVEVC